MIQGRGSVRTQTVLICADPVCDLGQRKLPVSKNIGDSQFRYDLDGVRFMEPPDKSHADI